MPRDNIENMIHNNTKLDSVQRHTLCNPVARVIFVQKEPTLPDRPSDSHHGVAYFGHFFHPRP
jgi:hypothetical protein